MQFENNISESEYKEFFNNHQNAHFLQSYAWGQTCKKNRNQIPCYVGLRNKKKLVAAGLLLKKNTPFKMCYFYAPRGFLINWEDKKIVNAFTDGLKNFIKEENGIYLRVDPGIKYQDIDDDGNKIESDNNNYQLLNYLINLGYKHQGFPKLYEGNQPRYTFRNDLNQDIEDIESKFSKSFLKTVKKSYYYELEIKESNSIKNFYELYKLISEKNGFTDYHESYFENFYQEFIKENNVKIFEAIINPKKLLKKLNETLNELNNYSGKKQTDNENMIKKCEKDIELIKPLIKNGSQVICSLICVYTKKGAWTLYIGNNELGAYTGGVNRVYYEALADAYNNSYDFFDLFGTVGDPQTTYKNLAGLHDFKRKFGGEYIEFIGEFDLINKPFWYKTLPIILKIYRKIRRS